MGNVRVTYKRASNGSAEIVSRADFYLFGGALPGRVYNANQTRFAYQANEKAQDASDWDQFELRLFNHDLGRWFAPDPYREFASPYSAMANNPVNATDPNGGQINFLRSNSNSQQNATTSQSYSKNMWKFEAAAAAEYNYVNKLKTIITATYSKYVKGMALAGEVATMNSAQGLLAIRDRLNNNKSDVSEGLGLIKSESWIDNNDFSFNVWRGIDSERRQAFYIGNKPFLDEKYAWADGTLQVMAAPSFEEELLNNVLTYAFLIASNSISIPANTNEPTNSNVSDAEFLPYNVNGEVMSGGAQGGGGGDRNLSDPKQYPGISIYQNNDKSDMTAVTLPGFGIYIGGGYKGDQLKMVMQHEYGHYLDYKFSPDLNFNGQGFTNFYLMIGVPSLFNAATGIGGSHDSYWTEIRANRWAEIWFGKNLHPNFLDNYPTK